MVFGINYLYIQGGISQIFASLARSLARTVRGILFLHVLRIPFQCKSTSPIVKSFQECSLPPVPKLAVRDIVCAERERERERK